MDIETYIQIKTEALHKIKTYPLPDLFKIRDAEEMLRRYELEDEGTLRKVNDEIKRKAERQ